MPGRIWSASLTSRSRNILIQLFLVFLVAYSALVAIYYNATHDYAIAEAEKLIESELLTHRAMHSYIEDIQKPEIYRLKDEGKLYREYFSPKILSFTFAARGVKELLNQERAKVDRPKIYFKLAAYNPRNPINTADTEELELLKKMNRDEIEEFKQIRDFEGQPHLYYAIPINPNKKSCMRCHSDPAIAPAELVEMYGDKAGFYEEIGDIRAMISIRVPLEQQFAESNQIFYGLSGITLGTLAAIYLLIVYFFRTIDHKQQQLITANIELNRLSVTDPLTGLHNRLRFNEDIERELAESERYDSPLTLLMLDLDHFKQLNDTLGHQAGDAALKHAAAILSVPPDLQISAPDGAVKSLSLPHHRPT
ncbi:DUF3365 domain-containing protein [Candidatus Reidiella endopervernicosa]|uniref:diguanylate cyclase n=1 Tax=Candidatus Reidiella endopervernicosa TaxID=2738883 RepID=A0A6N0I005_9GAMM|nr:DUF3365 domain-containing protein [Solemya pervernicosa gill symbiont]QKQ27893.1 DUF3365 domain-containing protein [Candidatus Reidiella endopervernicosa]